MSRSEDSDMDTPKGKSDHLQCISERAVLHLTLELKGGISET